MSEPTVKELSVIVSAVVSDLIRPLSQEALDAFIKTFDKSLVEAYDRTIEGLKVEAMRGDDPNVAVVTISGPYELMKPLLGGMEAPTHISVGCIIEN